MERVLAEHPALTRLDDAAAHRAGASVAVRSDDGPELRAARVASFREAELLGDFARGALAVKGRDGGAAAHRRPTAMKLKEVSTSVPASLKVRMVAKSAPLWKTIACVPANMVDTVVVAQSENVVKKPTV